MKWKGSLYFYNTASFLWYRSISWIIFTVDFFPFGLHICSGVSYSKNSSFDTAILLAPPSRSYIQQDFISSLLHLTLDNLLELSFPLASVTLLLRSFNFQKIITKFQGWLQYLHFLEISNSTVLILIAPLISWALVYPLLLPRYTVARFIFLL